MRGRDVDFTAFVVESRDRLARVAYLMCGDWHRAEDALQTAFVNVYPHWERVTGRGDPYGYVRRALVHALVDERRRPWRREQPVDQIADERDPVAASEPEERALEALAKIPAGQRAVVVLRHIEGLSVAEVSAELGIAEGTVKSQGARGLAALRELVSTQGGRL